jgi:hypothetical protein
MGEGRAAYFFGTVDKSGMPTGADIPPVMPLKRTKTPLFSLGFTA